MLHRSHHENQVVVYTCNLSTTGRLRQEDDDDFKVSLGYTEFEANLGYSTVTVTTQVCLFRQ